MLPMTNPPAAMRSLPRFVRSEGGLSIALVVVAIILVVVSWISILPSDKGGMRAVSAAVAGPLVLHSLPNFVVDLKSPGSYSHKASLGILVEVPEEIVPRLEERQAQIVSELQIKLRERQRRELVGEAGAEMLRQELLDIVDAEIAPEHARSILFSRFIVD